jgi:hypothetical protein
VFALCFGCSLLAPSKDEIANGQPSGGTSAGGSGGGSAGVSSGGTAGNGGTAGSGNTGGSSGNGGSAGASLLFADEFDDPKPDWQFGGETGWSLSGGEALQSDSGATYAIRWLPALANLTDYRIEVRARRTAPSLGALQVLFRQTADDTFYYCSFHPSLGEMFWGKYTSNWDTEELGTAPTFAVDYDPNQSFTMTLIADGTQFTCRVEEVPAAVAVMSDLSYPAGSPGLKTYLMAAAYDYIRVYSK